MVDIEVDNWVEYVHDSESKGKRSYNKVNAETMIGKEYGEWMVVGPVELRNGIPYIICVCSCGNIRSVKIYSLIENSSKSCGCKTGKKLVVSTKRAEYVDRRFKRVMPDISKIMPDVPLGYRRDEMGNGTYIKDADKLLASKFKLKQGKKVSIEYRMRVGDGWLPWDFYGNVPESEVDEILTKKDTRYEYRIAMSGSLHRRKR